MKIPIKDFVLKILQEQGLPTTTASKQLGKTYNKLVGKSRENSEKEFLRKIMLVYKKYYIKVDNHIKLNPAQ